MLYPNEPVSSLPSPVERLEPAYGGAEPKVYYATHVDALLAAKAADIAKEKKRADRAERVGKYQSDQRAMKWLRERAESAESKVADLERSLDIEKAAVAALSVVIDAQECLTLQKALDAVRGERLEGHESFLAAGNDEHSMVEEVDWCYSRAINDAENAILALIPTSPATEGAL